MDSIKVRTPHDFDHAPAATKRNRHSSIACAGCRRLKIRCQGGESRTRPGHLELKPCSRCASLGKRCEWPEEDGRKQKRQKQSSMSNSDFSQDALQDLRRCSPLHLSHDHSAPVVNNQHHLVAEHTDAVTGGSHDSDLSASRHSNSAANEASYTTVHYYRHLGPTAIAPGHKRISLKAREEDQAIGQRFSSTNNGSYFTQPIKDPCHNGCLPLFDPASGLPEVQILPSLLDKFFEFYSGIYCFLNRSYLEELIGEGRPPVFLICVMSALSSRFCQPELFSDYFPPTLDSRQAWEYSAPFLERSKAMIMSAISLPSPDVVAGLLMMAFADFGDNNEAGLWMFTGMALRMAQELGLHRERGSLDTSPSQTEQELAQGSVQSGPDGSNISLQVYQESSEIILFWSLYSMDTSLCNGTGRVPSLKRHEINVRLPLDVDIAIVRAGPGSIPEPSRVEVFPQMAQMMLIYAQSIDFLNTGSKQIRFQSQKETNQRMNHIDELKQNLIRAYQSIPRDISFGAIFYQAAVKRGQAGPYLLLHLQYHLQIAFLTQESLAGEENADINRSIPSIGTVETSGRETHPDSKNASKELYRNAIKSITDMLTIARLIDDKPLLSIVYLNQAFFHAACAYSRDMLQRSDESPSTDLSPSAFPLPSETSPSMVFPLETRPHSTNGISSNGSGGATESTYNFLTLIARTNYQFLRQAVRDQAKFYAGSGWVDAVLDQRETGLRDVDLSIVSDSISTFIRLHNLRGPTESALGIRMFAPPIASEDPTSNDLNATDAPWTDLPATLSADADLHFDPQAFFNDYMFTELASQNGYEFESQDNLEQN